MKLKKHILLIICILSFSISNAQDTIMLMCGKRIAVSNSKIEVTAKGDTVVSYQLPNGKQKSKRADKVFSVSQGGREHILYVSDTAAGDLTVDQMRRFLQGKADYSGGFSWGFFAGGVAATAVGAAIPSVRFNLNSNNASVPVGLVVPFGYIFVAGNTTKSVEKLKAKYPDMPDDEYYTLGVQTAISQRRMRDGALGVLTGGVIWIVAAGISN
ncbi:MAG: hypothetical protein IKO46_07040 [Salinivirgaceae bacterium]|nr:hypothetical protein [Salinivirgaceae bacterium]